MSSKSSFMIAINHHLFFILLFEVGIDDIFDIYRGHINTEFTLTFFITNEESENVKNIYCVAHDSYESRQTFANPPYYFFFCILNFSGGCYPLYS
jgi:hypothetical protein